MQKLSRYFFSNVQLQIKATQSGIVIKRESLLLAKERVPFLKFAKVVSEYFRNALKITIRPS